MPGLKKSDKVFDSSQSKDEAETPSFVDKKYPGGVTGYESRREAYNRVKKARNFMKRVNGGNFYNRYSDQGSMISEAPSVTASDLGRLDKAGDHKYKDVEAVLTVESKSISQTSTEELQIPKSSFSIEFKTINVEDLDEALGDSAYIIHEVAADRNLQAIHLQELHK